MGVIFAFDQPPNTNHSGQTPNMSPQRYPMYDDSNRRVSHTSHDVSSDSGSMDAPRSSWSTQPSQFVFVKSNDHNNPMDRSPPKPEPSQSPHQQNGKYILPTGFASTSASPYSPDQSASSNSFKTVFETFPSVPLHPEIRPAPSERVPTRDFAIRIAPKRPIESDPDIKLAKLTSRTVTGENVSENNIVDGYVQFVFAHDPMYASDDTDSIIYLKKKILATPKTQDLTYSAWDIYALVLRLHVQEVSSFSF
jgi:ARS binding protein 2